MVFNLYWQELHPPQDNFRTACLPSTIQDDFSLIKSGYGACLGHSSAVYMFKLNGEIREDNLALLDEVDYARIRGIHSGRSTRIIKTGISLRRQLYFYVRKAVHYLTCAPFRLRTTSLCSHFTS